MVALHCNHRAVAPAGIPAEPRLANDRFYAFVANMDVATLPWAILFFVIAAGRTRLVWPRAFRADQRCAVTRDWRIGRRTSPTEGAASG